MVVQKNTILKIVMLTLIIASILCTSTEVNPNQVYAKNSKTTKINTVVKKAKKMKGKTRKAFPNFASRWCADFVCWTAKKAKLNNNKVYPKKRKDVSGLISWYKKKGRYHKNTKKFKPKKGDLAFFSTSSHVGIVGKVTKKHVYIIHGNWGGKVRYTKLKKYGYTKGQRAKIKGFARPAYA